MADHYYTPNPQSKHKPAQVAFEYRGHSLSFATDSGVFSRLELDRGTEILLNALPENLQGRVLDLGCGYGAIGVSIARLHPACQVTMADINQRAVELAAENACANGVTVETLQSDGFAALQGRTFDIIVQNPPIRAGKQVIYQMFADDAKALTGELYLVIRKQQGAESAQRYLQTLFACVEIIEKKSGYWIFRCTGRKETL